MLLGTWQIKSYTTISKMQARKLQHTASQHPHAVRLLSATLPKHKLGANGGGGGGASFVQTLAFDSEKPLQSSHATAASCHRAARGGVGGCHWHETVQFHPEQTRRAAHSGTSMQHEKSTKVLAHPVR